MLRPLTHPFKKFICSQHHTIYLLIAMIYISAVGSYAMPQEKSLNIKKWVGTWSTAPQLVETNNNPPAPGLTNNTIRQIVHVSIGGDSLRMRFTNEFSKSPVKMNSVHLAISKGGGLIDSTSDRTIYFNGNKEVIIAAGAAVMSDLFAFLLPAMADVAITIYFGDTPSDISGHPGSRTTSFILTGNQIDRTNFSGAITTDHWYYINTIEVLAANTTSAVSILGDSITDGRGSGTNKQNRWPDELSRRLQADNALQQVAVLNEGIGGNCVLGSGLGPSAIARFHRDVLNQNGVKWLIIFEGINDIGNSRGTTGADKVAHDLIAAFTNMIDSAHAHKMIVYGATLLPFGSSFYDSPEHQSAWKTINDWIRNSGHFDGSIDLDAALHDPADPAKLLPIYDSGDHLHPSEAGHFRIAQAVELALFNTSDTNLKNLLKQKE
jgi:lysophospholipase L1-like esterase